MVKRNIVLQELRRIEQKHGYLKAQDVLEDAESDLSPLHDLFDWDDTSAAQKFRLQQARQLITYVKVEVVGHEMPAYFNIRTVIKKEKIRGYFATEKVMSNKDLYAAVLDNAIKELEFYEAKYKEIEEVHGLINVTALKALKRKAKK